LRFVPCPTEDRLNSADQLLLFAEPDWPPDPFDVRVRAEGLYVGCADLYLDARLKVDRCFISHAHTDHACAAHGVTVCTSATARFMRLRLRSGEFDVHPFGRPFPWGDARLTLHPAGHVLGSAQLLVEYGGQRLVYTGDIKLGPSLTCERAKVVPCDVLICESTFGLEKFRFPPVAQARRQIAHLAGELLAADRVPVFLGYSLGRGPELAAILAQAGFEVMVEESIGQHLRVYRELGWFDWPVRPLDPRKARGRVVVTPAGPAAAAIARQVTGAELVYVSGWAMLAGYGRRFGADHAVCLSDHADFDDLLRLAGRTGARKVYVTHGYTRPLRDSLAARGIPSRILNVGAPRRRARSP